MFRVVLACSALRWSVLACVVLFVSLGALSVRRLLRAPAHAPRAGLFLQIANLIGVGLLVSACASSHAAYDGHSNVGGPRSNQVAVSAPRPVELEGDGLAVQAPPRIREHGEPDDPSEPFSPNYGPAPAGVPDEAEPDNTRAAALRATSDSRCNTDPGQHPTRRCRRLKWRQSWSRP